MSCKLISILNSNVFWTVMCLNNGLLRTHLNPTIIQNRTLLMRTQSWKPMVLGVLSVGIINVCIYVLKLELPITRSLNIFFAHLSSSFIVYSRHGFRVVSFKGCDILWIVYVTESCPWGWHQGREPIIQSHCSECPIKSCFPCMKFRHSFCSCIDTEHNPVTGKH